MSRTLIASSAAAAAISVAVLTGTANLVKPHEGLRLSAYPDPGNPAIATICYGETKNVKANDRKTADECEAMLARRLPDYIVPVMTLMPGLPDNRVIAYSDAAYNVGHGVLTQRTTECVEKRANGSCAKKRDIPGTSIVDLERAGKWPSACARLKQFVFASGVKFAGLVKRREAEYRICMGES